MPCYHPLDAYRMPSGKPVFKRPAGNPKLMHLPCGRCIGCRLERSKQWAIRLMHEAQLHKENSFITLTYDDTKRQNQDGGAPSPPDPTGTRSHPKTGAACDKSQTFSDNHDQSKDDPQAREDAHALLARAHSLHIRDVQLFLKRLRKDQEQRGLAKIRYYAVGEYGENKGRPHYHAALFGEEFSGDRYHWRTSGEHKLYRSPRLEALWTHGNCEIGSLTFESAAYIARYITKKITGQMAEEHYKRRDLVTGAQYMLTPEFAIMSRGGKGQGRGGIGKPWLDKFMSDVYPHDYVVMRDMKLKPPRFYDKHFEAMEPELMKEIKRLRELEGAKQAGDNTPERLAAKETVATAKLKTKRRT